MTRIFQIPLYLSILLVVTAAEKNPFISLAPESQITAAPDIKYAKGLLPRQADYACTWISTVFKQCSDKGYFKVAGVSGLAACACYSDSVWNPYQVDGYVEQCYNYARTQDANVASGVYSFLGLCSSAGDIRAEISAAYTACSYGSSIGSFCSAEGYNKVSGPSQMAVCGCYSSGVYAPTILDGLWSSCFDYAQSAGETSLASAIWPLQGYCSSAGDVRQLMSEGSSICSKIGTVLASCSNDYASFRAGDRDYKASCFCYDRNTNFIGASRDKSAEECYSFATEYWYTYAQSVSTFQGLCSRAGDVRRFDSGSGSGGGSGSGADGVPSPGAVTTAPGPTSTNFYSPDPESTTVGFNSPNAAQKFEISVMMIAFLAMFCVTIS